MSESPIDTLTERQQTHHDLERRSTTLTRASTRRTPERHETRPTQDAAYVLDLPYDLLSEDADLGEYTEETAEGIKPKRTVSRVSGKVEDHELVTFKINDPENPKNWSKAYSMFFVILFFANIRC